MASKTECGHWSTKGPSTTERPPNFAPGPAATTDTALKAKERAGTKRPELYVGVEELLGNSLMPLLYSFSTTAAEFSEWIEEILLQTPGIFCWTTHLSVFSSPLRKAQSDQSVDPKRTGASALRSRCQTQFINTTVRSQKSVKSDITLEKSAYTLQGEHPQ